MVNLDPLFYPIIKFSMSGPVGGSGLDRIEI